MAPDFESHHNYKQRSLGDSPAGNMVALDMQKRDRFELLSAYLDGEVSANERRLVEEWLTTDPQVQCLYKRLLKLRQTIRTIPVPDSQESVENTVTQVFSRLNRRRKQMLMWGGTAVAAAFIASFSGGFGNTGFFAPQLAESPQITEDSEPLTIALNQPLIEIPKAPVALPVKTFNHSSSYYDPQR